MKQEYTNPIIEIITFTDEDILTTSSLGGDFAGDSNNPFGDLL